MPLSIVFAISATEQEIEEFGRVIEEVLAGRDEYWQVRLEEEDDAWMLTVSTGDLRKELPLFEKERELPLFRHSLQRMVQSLAGESELLS